MRIVLSFLFTLTVGGTLLAANPTTAEAQRRNRDLITREELMKSSQKSTDLFQAIRSLRSHFLAGPRGTRTITGAQAPTQPIVYVDGTRVGDISILRNLLTENTEEVRFVPPTEASVRYGLDHGGGVILVKTVSPPPGPGEGLRDTLP